ncbi:MAG: hypothetical protein ACKOQ7_02115 [Actinomycetota bacterium]
MGWSTLEVSTETVNNLYENGEVGAAEFGPTRLMVNEFAVVRSGSQ